MIGSRLNEILNLSENVTELENTIHYIKLSSKLQIHKACLVIKECQKKLDLILTGED